MRVYYVEKDQLYGDTDYSRGQRPMIIHRQVYLRSDVDATLSQHKTEIIDLRAQFSETGAIMDIKDATIALLEREFGNLSMAVVEFGKEALESGVIPAKDRDQLQAMVSGMESMLKEFREERPESPPTPNPCRCGEHRIGAPVGIGGMHSICWIECHSCGVKTEKCTSVEEAILEWNKENPRT